MDKQRRPIERKGSYAFGKMDRAGAVSCVDTKIPPVELPKLPELGLSIRS
jgi:hypothetical protein